MNMGLIVMRKVKFSSESNEIITDRIRLKIKESKNGKIIIDTTWQDIDTESLDSFELLNERDQLTVVVLELFEIAKGLIKHCHIEESKIDLSVTESILGIIDRNNLVRHIETPLDKMTLREIMDIFYKRGKHLKLPNSTH